MLDRAFEEIEGVDVLRAVGMLKILRCACHMYINIDPFGLSTLVYRYCQGQGLFVMSWGFTGLNLEEVCAYLHLPLEGTNTLDVATLDDGESQEIFTELQHV